MRSTAFLRTHQPTFQDAGDIVDLNLFRGLNPRAKVLMSLRDEGLADMGLADLFGQPPNGAT